MEYRDEELTRKNLNICLEKYKEDNNIFEKVIKMYETYSKEVDWPYSIERLDEVTSEVIGVRFSIFSNLGIEVKGNDDFKWDCVPKDFYKEFIFFYNTVGIQFNNAWYRRFAPEELATISYTKGFDNKYRVRIVRNDNRYVDICVSRHEVREMIFSLEEMIKNHDFEEEIPYGK